MKLIQIDPRFLDSAWPRVEGLLSSAIATNHGEHTPDQLRMEIAYGVSILLVYADDAGNVGSAATVQFKQYPGFRSAWISYLAGKSSPESWGALTSWAKDNGASCIECLCGPSQARLFERFGFKDTYRVMRNAL